MSSLKLLAPIYCLLVLLLLMAPSNASEGLWRAPYSIPGYPPVRIGENLDPRPPRGYEWSWVYRADNIWTKAGMIFYVEFKNRKPIFNYYLVSECPDGDTNEVYRQEVKSAIDKELISKFRILGV
jgi:hypothetical protein